MRIDNHLTKQLPEYSRATLQKFIKQGLVRVNGVPTLDPNKKVSEKDYIEVDAPKEKSFAAEYKDFERNVIYDDDNVIVVNKPAGILTHAKGAVNDEFTVADYVKSVINSDDEDFISSNRAGIVHRLDRATSGVLIAAKNPEAQKLLQKQFADRKAHKTYIAIVEKSPKIDNAKIDLPIGRNPNKPSSFKIDAKGKAAVTNYQVMKHFSDGSALVELRPLTGRTHQLRVHLAYIGSPILGDPVYGSTKDYSSRMFLHAYGLEITIPGDDGNIRKTFRAELPDDFNVQVNKLERQ